jgi:hypothetical protein
MDYLLMMLILAGASACAIAAYELFDAIERDEFESLAAWSRPSRAAALESVPADFARVVRPPVPSGRVRSAIPSERRAKRTLSDPDRLSLRIRGLEMRLERLERECDRIDPSVAYVTARVTEESDSEMLSGT